MQAVLTPNQETTDSAATDRQASRIARTAAAIKAYTDARRQQLEAALAGDVTTSGKYAEQAKKWSAGIGRFIAMPIALVITAIFSAGTAQAADMPPATVRTAEVRQEVVQKHNQVTGTLRAVSRTRLAAQEEGAVRDVTVDEGSFVKKGQVIARLDDRRHRARLSEAEAALSTARAGIDERQAELIKARRDREKLTHLKERNAATDLEMRDAITAVSVAKAQLASAQRRVEQLAENVELHRIGLEDTRIIAPFDGRVVERHVEPGEWLQPGEPVATIVSSGTIEAWLEVPERYADEVAAHVDRVTVRIGSDQTDRKSRHVRMVPQVDPRARTFALIVELDNTNEALSPGMSVSAWIATGKAVKQTTVPKDSVIRTARGAHLFRAAVDENGQATAEYTLVKVLFETGDRVVIADSKLAQGDLVVVEGNERLIPTMPLVLAAKSDR